MYNVLWASSDTALSVPPTSDIRRVQSLCTTCRRFHMMRVPPTSHTKMFHIVKSLLPWRDRFPAHWVQEGKAVQWEVTEEQVQEWEARECKLYHH
jgi:hypothetical protein